MKFAMLVFAVLTCSLLNAQLSSRASKALKDAIGYDLKGYSIYSFPTNNFGVGTMCKRSWDLRQNMTCDMVTCYGLADEPATSRKWKTVNDFAYTGEGGKIEVTDTLNKIYGLGLLMPKILKVLNIDLGFEINNTKSVTLTIDSAQKRFLKFDKFMQFCSHQPENETIYKAWNNKSLVVATSDFVLLNYSLTVKNLDSFGMHLGVKLDSLLKIGNFSLDKDSLGITVKRKDKGTYIIASNKPIIFAVFVQKQKKLEKYGKEDSFKDWDRIKEEDVDDY